MSRPPTREKLSLSTDENREEGCRLPGGGSAAEAKLAAAGAKGSKTEETVGATAVVETVTAAEAETAAGAKAVTAAAAETDAKPGAEPAVDGAELTAETGTAGAKTEAAAGAKTETAVDAEPEVEADAEAVCGLFSTFGRWREERTTELVSLACFFGGIFVK